jgi:hypothetical protein
MSTGGCFLHCKPMSLDYFGNLVGDICSPFLATEHFLFDLKDKKMRLIIMTSYFTEGCKMQRGI